VIGTIDISWRSYRYFSVVGCGLVLLMSVGEAIGIFLLWIGAIDISWRSYRYFLLWIGAIDISWKSYRYFSVVGCGLVL
jgi:hypothetical protein